MNHNTINNKPIICILNELFIKSYSLKSESHHSLSDIIIPALQSIKNKNNLLLIYSCKPSDKNGYLYFSDNNYTNHFLYQPDNNITIFPFYCQDKTRESVLNFNASAVTKIIHHLGIDFLEHEPAEGNVCFAQSQEVRDDFKTYCTAQNLLDFIFGIVHSKSNFTTIDTLPLNNFWTMVRFGEQLRNLQLLNIPEAKLSNIYISSTGNFLVTDIRFSNDCIYFNKNGYFKGVNKKVWEYHIANCYPAQYWLLQHQNKTLTSEQIHQYKKIIFAINEMIRIPEKLAIYQ